MNFTLIVSTEISNLLSIDEWTDRAKTHAELLAPFADAFTKRRDLGITHPVYDFLFTYYRCSSQKLKQWVPSYSEHLTVTPEILLDYPWLNETWFLVEENVLSLNRERLTPKTRKLASFVADLCSRILERTPRFGCFGLHEWAMVYKSTPEEIRHQGYPLRLPSQEVDRLVESQMLCCTHYDAYRFFTEKARPLNVLNPVLETRLEMEQGGCIHANMDIYKWGSMLWPWVGSDFLAKAFLLAVEGRELDMRASPYDLKAHGFTPICIETEEGRKQYQKEQQNYAKKAEILRKELHTNALNFV